MHPDHALRALRLRADAGDRDRARVARENRSRSGKPIEIGEDPKLEIDILGRVFCSSSGRL